MLHYLGKKQQNVALLSKVVLLLNQNNTHKTHFVHVFVTSADNLSNCGMETHSLFVDSSVNNVLLPANPDFTSHFLKSSPAQTHYCKTIKLCN